MRVRNAVQRISEREQATGEVGMGVTLEFEYHRFSAAFHPDFPAHNSLGAIINFAAHHAVMESKRHEPMLAKKKPPFNPWEFPYEAWAVLAAGIGATGAARGMVIRWQIARSRMRR